MENRTELIQFKASPSEAKAIKELAERHNVRVSELIRGVMRELAQKEGLLPPAPQIQVLSETLAPIVA